MSLSRAALLLLVVVFVPGLDSRAQVRLERGRVLVRAEAAPLTEVLTRFSEVTGAKIVYGADQPRQIVSVEIDASSEADAISQLLEGQGLGYALRLDKSGKHVEMVLLTARGGEAAPPPTAGEGAAEEPEPPEIEPVPPAPEDAPQPPDQLAEPPAEPDTARPATMGLPPGMDPRVPEVLPPAGDTRDAGAPTQPETPAPSPSAPGAPVLPAPASYPVPASYPAPAPVLIPPRN